MFAGDLKIIWNKWNSVGAIRSYDVEQSGTVPPKRDGTTYLDFYDRFSKSR
jgi:hypothetical protein